MGTRISKNLNYLRQKGNRTKLWVAEQLSKSNSVIANYENGKANPPLPVIEQYAKLFNVYIGDLVGKDLWLEQGSGMMGNEPRAVSDNGRYQQRVEELLHGELDKKEARLAQLRRQIMAELKKLSTDPAKTAERDRLAGLLAILENDGKG